MRNHPYYKQVLRWSNEYAREGITDRDAVGVFIECETDEAIRTFRSELVGMKAGRFDPDTIKRQLGGNRVVRHGDYTSWAKLMLVWLNGFYKHS